MSFVRTYVMQAKGDAGDALEEALLALQTAVQALPGCVGIEVLRDLDRPGSFHFIERWSSQAEHREAGKALPPGLMQAIQGALGEAPGAFSLSPV